MQVQMAHAVSSRPSTSTSTCSSRPARAPASRWPTSAPAVAHAFESSASPPSWRRRPSPCRPRSSTATCPWCRRRPRPRPRPPPDVRARQGPPQLRVSQQARGRLPRRRGGAPSGSARSTRQRGASGRRSCGCASGPRAPTPATATSSSPVSPSGPGARSRCRRTSAWPASAPWSRSASSSALGGSQGRRRHRHQPLLHGDRCLRGPSDAPRARRARRRRGARARRPGDGDDHRRAHRVHGHYRRQEGRSHVGQPRRPRGGGRVARCCPRAARGGADVRGARLGRSRAGTGARHGTHRADDLKPPPGQEADGARQVSRAAVDEVHENAERILEERELDVVWLSRDPRRGPVLRVAPMSVAMLVRDKASRPAPSS